MIWRDIPSLAALRAFEAVAREGSITKAAESLNVTHAAIAQHIRTLENELQHQLTQRVGRGIVLTPEGHELAKALSEGFSQIHSGIMSLKSATRDRPLTISTTPSFAENWLIPRLGQFWRDHPEITVSISPSLQLVDLNHDGIDLAIRYGAGGWKAVESTFLVPADYILVAAPSLISDRTPRGIKDLQDLPWFFNSYHHEAKKWAIENGLDLRCCQVNELETLSMVLSAVRSGVGLSVLSQALIGDDLQTGRLRKIIDLPSDGMGYHMVTRKGVLSNKLKTFKKWLLSSV